MVGTITKAIADHLLAQGWVLARHRSSLETRYRDDLDIDLAALTPEGLDYVGEHGPDMTKRRVATYKRILDNPGKDKVGQLQNIPAMIRAILKDAPNKWLFSESEYGEMLPWFVVSCVYSKGERDNPATTTLSLAAYGHTENYTRGITWQHEQLAGKTILDLLATAGLVVEDAGLVGTYREHIQKFLRLRRAVGKQMLATGFATRMDTDRWDRRPEAMQVDSRPTKVVLDEETPELKDKNQGRGGRSAVSMKFWTEQVEEDGEEVPYEVPTHPFLYVFSLRSHRWLEIHVANLEPYEWATGISDKLILPEQDKELVRLLIQSTGNDMQDIVAGKSAGVIVLASGPPGVGKTLTAEVTSELLQVPLYAVQCSQLGTHEEAIEGKLSKVLGRATRWGAVMLIDEADVYVRARGSDIRQNAIVGVFLRTLEYYNGFLFLATNRATTVDDAILSRLTAHVRYQMPDQDRRRQILAVQAAALAVQVPDDVADYAVSLPLSGRDIRSVLKLAKFVTQAKGQALNLETFQFCLGYQDLADSEAE